MRKRILSLILALCLVLTAVPVGFAAEAPGSFDAYLTMTKLRGEYPEGTPWTNDNTYQWKGGIFTHGAGCAAFAFLLSDAVFGDLPARQLTGVSADALRPGDILRLNGDTHSVIVLQNTPYGIVIAEGNYNSAIHWDRVLSRTDAESADYVLTRYPENWVDSAPPKPVLESTQITNHLNWLEKSFPQGMHWGYDYSYNWQGGILNGSGGSYAFAMLLSDTVFSNLPACVKQGMSLADLREGDIVVDRNGGAGIVVEKLGDRVRLAEGQDGGIVNWQKYMSQSDMSQAIMTLTRYPDAQPPETEKSLEQKAQESMNALREQYPEGKPWGSGDSYTWNGTANETGFGCAAFAYILSDGAFGSLPAWERTEFALEDVRAGDILKTDGYTVIVLETYEDAVMIAEGEYNGGIHWGRYLSRAEVENAECMLTRYPLDYKDPGVTVQIYQPAGNVVAEGDCGFKGAPVYWKLSDQGTMVIYGSGATDNYNYNMGYYLPPWYDYRDSITRVVVQDGVWELGSHTLAQLFNLTEVVLPATLRKIGMDCFSSCTSLETLRLPQGLRELGNRVFQGCTALKNVNFPAALESIGSNCFEKTGLTRAELKAGLTHLGSNAFANCDGLTDAVLPGSLGSNVQNAFIGCDSLSSLILGEGITALGRSFAEGCVSLKQVLFPTTLTHIWDNAFDSTGLVEVTLPSGLEKLGNWAFSGCDSLETVTINCNVAEFGNNVFTGCDVLKNLNIGPEVQNLGKSTFSSCPALEYVRIPGSVELVDVRLFADNYNGGPVVLVLEEGVASIAKFAFESCDNLREVHLPASLTQIGEYAFDNDNFIKDITFYYNGTAEQWAQVEIQNGNRSFEGANLVFGQQSQCSHTLVDTLPGTEPTCQQTGLTAGQICRLCDAVLTAQDILPLVDHRYEGAVCVWCGAADPRPSYEVIASGQCGDQVIWELTLDYTLIVSGNGPMWDFTPVGDQPADDYKKKIKSIVIEPGVTSVGICSFPRCRELESISFGPDVQSIGDNAFGACYGLKKVVIPANVTYIDSYAFNNCLALEQVEFASGDIMLDSYIFSGCSALAAISIPEGNTVLENDNPFITTPFLTEGMNSEGFNIVGDNLIYYGGKTSEPVIPETVKHIASHAFEANSSIQKIKVPENVEDVGSGAFLDCVNLREVVFSGSVKRVGPYCFTRCYQLREITFSGDAPKIDYSAFRDATVQANYPADNYTWLDVTGSYFEGSVTWIPYEACKHNHKTAVIGYAATCTKPGYSSELYCNECGKILEAAKELPALGHEWKDGVCVRCGEKEAEGIMGDADGDGSLTYNDALLALRYSIGLAELENVALADVDGDGDVTYNDALTILRMSIGL